MKLNKNDNLNENTELYSLSEINDFNEVIIYYSSLYNGLTNINVTEYKNNEIITDERYETINDLFSKRSLIDLNFNGTISFESPDRSNYILINTPKMLITQLKTKTTDISNKQIQYYKDDFDNIIKYENISGTFYVLDIDGKTWVQNNSYLREYNNGDLTLIDYSEGEKKI